MSNRVQPIYQVGGATGTTVTSGAATANVAIPNDSNGTSARVVMLTAGANAGVHVKLGTTNAVVATANDLMIGATPVVVNARGYTWIAYIQETAATKLQIAPVEDA